MIIARLPGWQRYLRLAGRWLRNFVVYLNDIFFRVLNGFGVIVDKSRTVTILGKRETNRPNAGVKINNWHVG